MTIQIYLDEVLQTKSLNKWLRNKVRTFPGHIQSDLIQNCHEKALQLEPGHAMAYYKSHLWGCICGSAPSLKSVVDITPYGTQKLARESPKYPKHRIDQYLDDPLEGSSDWDGYRVYQKILKGLEMSQMHVLPEVVDYEEPRDVVRDLMDALNDDPEAQSLVQWLISDRKRPTVAGWAKRYGMSGHKKQQIKNQVRDTMKRILNDDE